MKLKNISKVDWFKTELKYVFFYMLGGYTGLLTETMKRNGETKKHVYTHYIPNYLQGAKMKQWGASSLQTVALWTDSREWKAGFIPSPLLPPPPNHPVISLEAGPGLVPIPSGRCHLSRVLPAVLWLQHSTTIVIKMVIFVLGGDKKDFFSKLWTEVL